VSNTNVTKGRITVLLLALAAIGSIAAYSIATASAEGRTVDGAFCLGASTPFCLQASFDGQTAMDYGTGTGCGPLTPHSCTPTGTGALDLRPGTQWIGVTDNHNAHNFELRSCPDSTTACTDGNGDESKLTPVCNTSGSDTPCGGATTTAVISDTLKINLKPGTYRLFCDVPGHEAAGMYVDFVVGGVGQDG